VTVRHQLTPRPRRGDLALADWRERRSYDAEDFPLERLCACKRASVSVVLPAREVADTIGPILERLVPLREAGAIDELLVIDAASRDGTGALAERLGATVVQRAEILPEYGPSRGKGDALWRALAVTTGDVVAFLDADTENFDQRFARGLLGPLLADDGVAFVKGAYRRPFRLGEHTVPDGGGRVTELLARPLLNRHVPELAGFVQPLAGEFAGRRTLLEALPFPVGYGVEIATLIDALRHAGLDALAQVDLGTRQNRHQPLRALSAMAYAVLTAVERRLPGPHVAAPDSSRPLVLPHGDELELVDVAVEERPPLRALRRAA
jgi:glucosyl-3-phosphoglycerate synthase